MNRKIVSVLIMVAALSGTAFAEWYDNPQVRLALDTSTGMEQTPTLRRSVEAFEESGQEELFGGLHWEIIFGQVGFGMRYMFKTYAATDPLPVTDTTFDNPWWIHWKGDLFLSYHPFAAGAVIDPFVEVGAGHAGQALTSSRNSNHADFSDEEDAEVTNMSIFYFGSVGVAFDLGGFLLGTRVTAFPNGLNSGVPGTDYYGDRRYPLPNYEVGVYCGVALGGHR